jgi:hypothetical protein
MEQSAPESSPKSTPIDSKTRIDITKDQLNRTLAFFARVDGKASVLLAVDTAMLGVLAGNAPALSEFTWYMAIAAVATGLLLGVSLWNVYKEAFPKLDSAKGSLIYFREISKRTENQFVEEFLRQSDEAYLKDMLGQVWRNSEILTMKFNHTRVAFNCVALSILPWLFTLALFIRVHQGSLFK